MTIGTVFNHGRVIWDDGGEEAIPEQAILIHVDNGGTICMEQEASTICIRARTVDSLCKVLREVSRLPKKK